MHILVGVCFSSWKNTLQKSAFQKLILLQNLHSLYVHSLFCPWNSDFSSSFTVKLTTEVIMLHKDTATDLLETAFIISATTTIHHILKWIPVHGVAKAPDGFSRSPILYEFFSFPSGSEVFNNCIIVLSDENSQGAQQVDCYVHMHLDIHTPVLSKSCSRLYMHVLVVVCSSAWKNTLHKTVVQKLILY